MTTLVGEIRDQEGSALSFKPGGSHIQIDSISIEISSGEINGAGKECKHFSIRGFVSEQRKKDIRLCSPFISDGDDDNSNTSSLELPPLDVHKFKWWRCSGCLQDRSSSQGTSKEIVTCKSIISQNLNLQEIGSSNGLSKLFTKANGNGFTKGKRLLQDDYSQGPSKEKSISGLSNSRGASFLKSISEAVTVPFKGLDIDKARPSRKSKVVMGPPSGPLQGTSNEFAMPPPHKSRSGKNISVSKQQNVQNPKPNVQIWQKGETSRAGTLHKKRNYAKRSVQQLDSGGDRVEIHKADGSFASNSNREAMQLDVPKEGDVQGTERLNDDQVTPQLDRNEEVGSSNRSIEKVPNHSTAGRATDPECSQFAEDSSNLRLLKRPCIEYELEAGRNSMYEEEEEEDYRGLHLRRVPKIRLLSDVIAKYPTSVGEQPENISAVKSSEQTKRPASPVASHDTSAERAVSDKLGQQSTKSVTGSWKKRRSLQDSEEHLADLSNGGSNRSFIRSSEPENRTEAEKKSKKTAVFTPVNGGQLMDKSNKQVFYPDKEERVQGFGKKKYCPQIGEDYQPATKFLQFGPDNVEDAPGEGTSDYINIFKRRSSTVENYENVSTPSSTVTDYLRTSVSTENDVWISQVQAGGTVVERKVGEGSSCTQQKGRVKDIDINSIPVDDKISELGASDDIPMDIVELLAKHQHERNREKLISLNPIVLKPQPSYYSRNGGLVRQFEPVTTASAKQNLFNQSRNSDPFYPRFSGYTTQGQVPGGAQYSSSIGSTAKSWNTNMGSFRGATSRNILPPVQSFNRFPQGPPMNAQIWPPPLYTPHSQGSDISFNIGNPNPNFLSPRRPVDLTPNDTIPAMQLLNLVQVAGNSRSSNTPPVNGNIEFLRKPYSPGLHFEPPYNNPPTPIPRHPLYNNIEGRSFIIDQRCPCSSALPTDQMFAASPFVRNPSSSDKKRKPTLAAKNASLLSLRTPVTDIVRKTEVCMINRNPAEILDLKVMRSFMIGPEDLRRGKPIQKGRGRPRLHKT